ncbi:AI-2E family transporter [Desemzia sp. RIT804]|uniref:AI-2E family transporter n=1 Tax=Desemzia sp. RIT 804 TaxID=2810209 RepID=UPI00194EDB02|nr:AI-2E family transporter [Desemzia sp. RIT 804]MBM6613471.1 AI-2E family transporter [Desemzia sp. RIT 804]
MKKMKDSKLMFWSVWLLIVVTIIFIMTKIDFLFFPVTTFIATLFMPILTAGFLYYLLTPIVSLLEKINIKRKFATPIVLLAFISIVIILILTLIPAILAQVGQLLENLPKVVSSLEMQVAKLEEQDWFKEINVTEIVDSFGLTMRNVSNFLISNVTTSLSSLVGIVANTAIFVVTVPIMLFYMFRDGSKLPQSISRFLPTEYRTEMIGLMGQMNDTISSYISGQALVCLFIGIFTYLGYLLIGQPYALLLGLIAGVTNIIPYLGPFIGAAPAVVLAFTISPAQALKVALVVLVIQQIESNLVSPNIIGKTLDIHPLTIIVLLLVAGNLAGVLGMITAVPTYAVTKTIIIYVHNMYKLRKEYKYKNLKENTRTSQ